MASFLGIEIAPDVVRGAVVKTAFRSMAVARYIEVPVRDDEYPSSAPAYVTNQAPIPEPASPNQSGQTSSPDPKSAVGQTAASLAPGPGAPVAPGAIVAPLGDSPPDPVARALRRLLDIAQVPANMVVCALPGADASVRRIELPAAAARKLDELLPLEMELIVPFDPDETILDHQPISTVGTSLRVLVVTAPKARIRERLGELDRLGLDPVELGPGAASLDGLAPLVPGLSAAGTHCLIHAAAHRTDIAFFVGGKVEFARTISVGARDIGAEGTRGNTDRWIRELRQTAASWRIQNGSPIASLLVSGSGANSEAVQSLTTEVFGLSPSLLELPDSSPETSSTSHAERASFAFALGLAARAAGRGKHIDLRKGEFVVKRTMSVLSLHAPVFAACAALVLLSFIFATYARYSVLASRRTALEDQLATMTRERLGLETRSPAQARTLLQTGLQRRDPLPEFSAFDALAAVSSAIPTEMTHDLQRMRIDLGDDRNGGRIEIAGMLGSAQELDQVTQAMRDVRCFREVDVGPLTGTGERNSYRIEADLQCSEPEEDSRSRRRSGGN